MKKPGYLFHKDGRIVFNPELKPKSDLENDPLDFHCITINISKWNDNCLPVENVWYCHLNNCWCINDKHPTYRNELVDAQKCIVETKVIELI